MPVLLIVVHGPQVDLHWGTPGDGIAPQLQERTRRCSNLEKHVEMKITKRFLFADSPNASGAELVEEQASKLRSDRVTSTD